jgi:hypothetical protein
MRFSFQGAVVRYTVNSEVGGGKLKGRGTARQKTSAKRSAAEASSHTEGDSLSDATFERRRLEADPYDRPRRCDESSSGRYFLPTKQCRSFCLNTASTRTPP